MRCIVPKGDSRRWHQSWRSFNWNCNRLQQPPSPKNVRTVICRTGYLIQKDNLNICNSYIHTLSPARPGLERKTWPSTPRAILINTPQPWCKSRGPPTSPYRQRALAGIIDGLHSPHRTTPWPGSPSLRAVSPNLHRPSPSIIFDVSTRC